jgi:hypothetical protein
VNGSSVNVDRKPRLRYGEVGVSVSLGRFSVDEEGLIRVRVSVARSGLDGAFIEYVLEPADDGWTIRETIFDEAVQ